ncbi:MAG: hypothetical protein IJM44_02435, partial [Ruminococcus sp.]|nr:hypothetical protein [Ruminococcus sp.]
VNYIPDKKVLVNSDYDTTVRITTNSYMGLNDGELVTVVTTGTEYNELGELFNVYVNGECVDQETYDELVAMYDGGRQTLGREFRANIAEIELALYGASTWEQTYSEYLAQIADNRTYEDMYPTFSLYDITGDGVPELFISEGWAHAARVLVYTFDGRLRSIGTIGTYGGTTYYVEPQILLSYDMHMGYEYGGDYEVRDFRFARVFTYSNNCGAAENEADREYKINDKLVTEEEYNAALDERSAEHFVWLGNDNELDSTAAANVADGIYTESEVRENTVQ